MPSLTQRITNLLQFGPVIEIVITPSVFYSEKIGIPFSEIKTKRVLAMIDTGATASVISYGIAEFLGIEPVGNTYITTPTSTRIHCFQYDVQLAFPNNVNIASLIVVEAPLEGQHIQCLIGRDVLKHGLFIYNGYDNSFTLSF